MTVTVTKLPDSQIEIRGTLPASEFARYLTQTTARIVREAEIEGFRKGKAPEKLVVEKIGEDKLLHQAAEEALKHEWPKVLEENKIEAIGPAEFHVTKLARGNDLEWVARIAILPEIALPDWRIVAKDINKKKGAPDIEVTDKEVNETLAYIQRVRAKEGDPAPPAGPDGTVGAGGLDDAYAQTLGNFPTLEALKNNIRDGIRVEKEEKAREAHRARLIEAVAEKTTVEIPQVMTDAERAKMLRELRASIEDMGLKWDDYLTHLKKSESELTESWTKDAEKRVRIGMTLREIARAENVTPTDDEIAERTKSMLRPYSEEELRNIDRNEVRDYAKGIVRNEKVLDMLELQ